MEEKHYIPAGAIFDRWSEAAWDNGVQIDRMPELEKLVVRTVYSLYEITVLNGRKGDVLIRGGKFFPELTPVHLAGATLGGSFLKMRGIYTGFKMEIYSEGKRIITSTVQTIGVIV